MKPSFAFSVDRFLELSVDLCCVASFDGFFLQVNPRFCEVLGYSEEELLSTPFLDFVHPEDIDSTVAEMEASTEGQDTLHFKNRYRTASGDYRWLSWNSRVVVEDGVIYAIARDITEAEEARRVLEASQARYHGLYARTPAMLHSIDAQGRLVEVSEFWQRKMGYSSEEVLGRRSTEFLTPESQELASRILPEFMETGECNDVPYRFVTAGGEEFDVLLSAIAEKDEEGRVLRSLAVSVDITERLIAERALKESHDALLRQSQELREMAIAASHDLKAPVRNVQMFTALALEECGGKVGEYLEFVKEAADRLQCIAGDLTRYMSLESRSHTCEEVDLQQLVETILKGLQGSFPEESPSFELAELPVVFGVKKLLYSLFENVFSNAIKFREEEPLEISLELKEEPEQWVFILQDNGVGIEETFHEDVFKLFRRLDKRVEGTGAGLAMTKKIVEIHGGTIRFLPSSNGARLRFTLPKTGVAF